MGKSSTAKAKFASDYKSGKMKVIAGEVISPGKIAAKLVSKIGSKEALKVGQKVGQRVAETIKVPKPSTAGGVSKSVRAAANKPVTLTRRSGYNGTKSTNLNVGAKKVEVTTPKRSLTARQNMDASLKKQRNTKIVTAADSARKASAPIIGKAKIKAGAKGVAAGVVGSQVADKAMNKMKKKK